MTSGVFGDEPGDPSRRSRATPSSRKARRSPSRPALRSIPSSGSVSRTCSTIRTAASSRRRRARSRCSPRAPSCRGPARPGSPTKSCASASTPASRVSRRCRRSSGGLAYWPGRQRAERLRLGLRHARAPPREGDRHRATEALRGRHRSSSSGASPTSASPSSACRSPRCSPSEASCPRAAPTASTTCARSSIRSGSRASRSALSVAAQAGRPRARRARSPRDVVRRQAACRPRRTTSATGITGARRIAIARRRPSRSSKLRTTSRVLPVLAASPLEDARALLDAEHGVVAHGARRLRRHAAARTAAST